MFDLVLEIIMTDTRNEWKIIIELMLQCDQLLHLDGKLYKYVFWQVYLNNINLYLYVSL